MRPHDIMSKAWCAHLITSFSLNPHFVALASLVLFVTVIAMLSRFDLPFTRSSRVQVFSSVCKLIRETKDQLSMSVIHRNASGSAPPVLSPVPHLLHSNVPPSDEEVTLISGAMTTVQRRLSALGEEVHLSPKSSLDTPQFEKRRSVLLHFQSAHTAVLSPLRRLPPEILELIFRETVDEQFPTITQSSDAQLPAVSQVSRLWRNIALSTPALWNNITADLSKKYSSSRSFMQLLHLRLLRSNKSHLNIFLTVLIPSHAAHPALNILLDRSDRWKTANMHISPSVFAKFRRIEGHLSALRSLELTIHRYGRSHQPIFTIFEDAPMLREVYLRGERHSIHFEFPWGQLVHYEDDHGEKGISGAVFKSLTAAKDLKLNWRSSEPLTDDLTLNNLESLNVQFTSFSYRGFFEHLTLPNIKDIKVLKHPSDPTPRLVRMIEGSSSPCLLHTLTLRTDFRRPDSLTALLRLTPALEDLDIHIPSARDISHLVVKSYRTPLVPKLRKLHFVASTVKDVEEILRNLASSRCKTYSMVVTNNSGPKAYNRKVLKVCKLDSFSIEFPDDSTRLEERELLEIRAQYSTPDVSDELDRLKRWKEALLELSYTNARTTRLSIRGSPNSGRLEKLDEVLSSVAKYHVRDIRRLHLSSLHIELHRFAHRAGPMLGDRKYCFRRRAREVLDGWAGMLLEDTWDRRWALKDQASLVYTPADNGASKFYRFLI
ncbi:hypothetical protein GALMADRAFT_1063309 [Galerina marginata CBS 339.88]|uniref:F-box domain-containing protein n=1 Tax=Galerina marginata (strain CBS 339.88) TaxID=685588 RepID=A0A067SAD4_GALM3|nr:hypothetical protein GALMADRAFT_1063309 [Galerina marginata CBS 339.88]